MSTDETRDEGQEPEEVAATPTADDAGCGFGPGVEAEPVPESTPDDAPADDAADEGGVTAEAATDAPEEAAHGGEQAEPLDAADAVEIPAELSPDDVLADAVEMAPRLDLGQIKAIVEALLFASPEPLTPKTLFKLLADEPREDVVAAIEAVQHDYESRPGLQVAEVAGGFQITTRSELHEWVRRLFHERTTQKLSVAALETLSVIAYKQPITQAEIGEIRGVNASGVLSTLLERHLIKIVGRKNVVGRPFLYGTTREFLIRFGLKDVSDLPKIEDMAQQLGFEPPSVLMERPVSEDMLPLEEDSGEVAAGEPQPDQQDQDG